MVKYLLVEVTDHFLLAESFEGISASGHMLTAVDSLVEAVCSSL